MAATGTAVEVHSDGLLLRPWTSADAPQVAEASSDPSTALWNPMTVSAADWCAARADWSDGSHASWAIVEPADAGLVLGSVSVFHIDTDQECARGAPPSFTGTGAGSGTTSTATASFALSR